MDGNLYHGLLNENVFMGQILILLLQLGILSLTSTASICLSDHLMFYLFSFMQGIAIT